MPFVVVYDASVLHPSTVRDLLIRIAQAGLVQARWTDGILDETFRSIVRRRPGLDPQRLERTRSLMNAAIRDVLVVGHEPLIGAVELPDPDDRHVLAAAIKARAQIIVTSNLKDFPPGALAPWNIEAKSRTTSSSTSSTWTELQCTELCSASPMPEGIRPARWTTFWTGWSGTDSSKQLPCFGVDRVALRVTATRPRVSGRSAARRTARGSRRG